jgi:hypothetical protein
MNHTERTALVEVVKSILPEISHTRWPSGICSDHCQGCRVQWKVNDILDLLKKDIEDELKPAKGYKRIFQDVPDIVYTSDGPRLRKPKTKSKISGKKRK